MRASHEEPSGRSWQTEPDSDFKAEDNPPPPQLLQFVTKIVTNMYHMFTSDLLKT